MIDNLTHKDMVITDDSAGYFIAGVIQQVPTFPVKIGFNGVSAAVQADGSVIGDREAWGRALADHKSYFGSGDGAVFVTLALMLNAPWRAE